MSQEGVLLGNWYHSRHTPNPAVIPTIQEDLDSNILCFERLLIWGWHVPLEHLTHTSLSVGYEMTAAPTSNSVYFLSTLCMTSWNEGFYVCIYAHMHATWVGRSNALSQEAKEAIHTGLSDRQDPLPSALLSLLDGKLASPAVRIKIPEVESPPRLGFGLIPLLNGGQCCCHATQPLHQISMEGQNTTEAYSNWLQPGEERRWTMAA